MCKSVYLKSNDGASAMTQTQATAGERVLVTGGSGYIGGFCIAQLLAEGYQVRATIRNLARADAVRASLLTLNPAAATVEFVAADLGADDGWDAAVKDCAYVLHVASPLPSTKPENDDVLVKPARDGALRVLAAATRAGVKRVVLTSSTAAVCYGSGSYQTPRTEADWSSPDDRTDSSAYERSKMIAERAAWAWHGGQAAPPELVTVCPGAVLGPVFGKDFSASIDIVRKQLDGSLPGTPRFGWPLVDVRDIADLHIRAMKAPGAAGQRYIGAGPFIWMRDVADMLRDTVPELKGKVPKGSLPDFLVRLSAMFDPVVKERLFELGKARPVSADKAKRELGWTQRPYAETVADTARSLVREGVIKG
jgi:dihydroflavonol-4-reductase